MFTYKHIFLNFKRHRFLVAMLAALILIGAWIASFWLSSSTTELVEIRSTTSTRKLKPVTSAKEREKAIYQQFYTNIKPNAKITFAKETEDPIELPNALGSEDCENLSANTQDIFSKVNIEVTNLNFLYLADEQYGTLPSRPLPNTQYYYIKLGVAKSRFVLEQKWQQLSKYDKLLASYTPIITSNTIDGTILYAIKIQLKSFEEARAICKKMVLLNNITCLIVTD